MSADEAAVKAAQLEVAPHQFELRAGRAADNHVGAVAGVLGPVGTQAVSQAEQGFAGMLGEFQEPRDPAAVLAMSLVFDVEEPLEGIGLGLLLELAARDGGIEGLESIKALRELTRI